jgi:hypothetical protein
MNGDYYEYIFYIFIATTYRNHFLLSGMMSWGLNGLLHSLKNLIVQEKKKKEKFP